MKEKTIEGEFKIDDDGNLQAKHGQLFGTEKKDYRPGQLSSNLKFLHISKSNIEDVYNVREGYLMIKHIIACC